MPSGQADGLTRPLRRPTVLSDPGSLLDGQLLDRFLAGREQGAFAELLRRHGPMVMGVCRRILGHAQDAEDAFQATFLVLSRKANAIIPRALIGNWLYGVAYRTAMRARATSARRRSIEQKASRPEAVEARAASDLGPLLDEELSRLPDKYRVPLVLCELEGKTRKEAARQLGWPEGTVAGRLARGRDLLARRLERRGVTVPLAVLVATLCPNAASASVPVTLIVATAKAAAEFRAGAKVTAASEAVATLAREVLRNLLLKKLTLVFLVSLVLGLTGVGTVSLVQHALAAVHAHPKATSQPEPKTGGSPPLSGGNEHEPDP